MTESITAIYDDGVFRPEQTPQIPPGTRVRLTVDTLSSTSAQQALEDWDRFCEQHPIDSQGDWLTRDELHDRS